MDNAMQRNFRGSGLGLPLSKGLAELLGGRVWVDSALGQGSTFYAEIPAGVRGSGSRERRVAPGPNATSSSSTTKRCPGI